MATKPAHDSVETAHEHMHGMPSIMFASLDPDTHGSNFRPDLVAADPTHVSVAGSPPLELERVYSEPLPSTVAMFEDMFGTCAAAAAAAAAAATPARSCPATPTTTLLLQATNPPPAHAASATATATTPSY